MRPGRQYTHVSCRKGNESDTSTLKHRGENMGVKGAGGSQGGRRETRKMQYPESYGKDISRSKGPNSQLYEVSLLCEMS